jgi:hypothetical protein
LGAYAIPVRFAVSQYKEPVVDVKETLNTLFHHHAVS